jgi:hypothetical protein
MRTEFACKLGATSVFFVFAIHRLLTQDHSVLQRAMRVVRENNSLDLIFVFCLLVQKLPIDLLFSAETEIQQIKDDNVNTKKKSNDCHGPRLVLEF